MRKPKEKIKLDIKKVGVGQYGESEDDSVVGEFDAIENQYAKYASAVGGLIISFAELEGAVNNDLATAINERAHEPGYRIIKYLRFRDKINLLKDDYSAFIKYLETESAKTRLRTELKIIHDKLRELSEFRNMVAHADWQSLDSAGFVRTKIIESEEDFGLEFKKVKMTPAVLIKFKKQNLSVAKRLELYREKVWEAHRRDDHRRYKKNQKKNLI